MGQRVGRSAPDFELAGGTRLAEILRSGKGLLLDFDARPSLQALADCWAGRIAYAAGEAKDRLGLGALLIRPDGIVAWAYDTPTFSLEEARQATSRWFGNPR